LWYITTLYWRPEDTYYYCTVHFCVVADATQTAPYLRHRVRRTTRGLMAIWWWKPGSWWTYQSTDAVSCCSALR